MAVNHDNALDDISVIDVSKAFRTGLWKKKTVVESLTFSVPRGHMVGLLGPNGSGKSTTLKMIVGFLKPTAGDILLCGERAEERAARRHIGYLPENPRFPRFLRGAEALRYYGSLHGITGRELTVRVEQLLELVDLRRAADDRIGTYSKGMSQRLAIAQALINRPRVLLFDEPMSGLDPLGRMDIRARLARVHQEMPEATIFFSSHVLGDVEALCSHVALLRSGRLHRYAPMAELLAEDEQRFEIKTEAGTAMVVGTDALTTRLAELRDSRTRIVGISAQRYSLEEALFRERPAIAGGASR